VGFGELFLDPLRLESGREQVDPAGTFRLVEVNERLQLEKLESSGRWKQQYFFSLKPRNLDDFAGMCHYHQTSPESRFTQNRICSRATPDGRITLSGMKLIVTRNGQRQERMLSSESQWNNVLQEYFGIKL
jgi:N-hydroxyarylamine O-acetyltransferase